MKMNEIKIFEHIEFGRIRTVMIDGEVWFVGKDVAEALGYSNSRKAIGDHVDPEDKGVTKRDTLGGAQGLTIINESGLYSLVLSSKLASAKRFKRWITSEVLPSLRKYGMYADTETLAKMACSPEPVTRQDISLCYLDRKSYLCVPTGNITASQVFKKRFGKSEKCGMGAASRCCGTWVLYQKYANRGYTKTKTLIIDRSRKRTVVHTYWTQLGRMFLYEVLLANGYLPLCERVMPS